MSRIRILVLDDSSVQLESFRSGLTGAEYDLSTATNTADAVRAMSQGVFDIVVIDYHLGAETGDACLKKLRESKHEDTRYFLYTTDPEAFRRHREMGFDGVLMLKGKAAVRKQIDAIARSIMRSRELTHS